MVKRFPAKKNAGCPKAPCDFPPRKDGILCPRRVVLGLPSPSHRVCGRTDGRSRDYYVTTKFLGLIGYHISLAMELRWRALPAGSAIMIMIMIMIMIIIIIISSIIIVIIIIIIVILPNPKVVAHDRVNFV